MKASLRLLLSATALASFAITDLACAQPAPPRAPPGSFAAPPAPPPGGGAFAAPLPPPPAGSGFAPPPPAATYDVRQLPETRGTVQRFTLTPRGELDGFVLTDGTDVDLPPHLSNQLAGAVRAGDAVRVLGYRSPSVPLVVATSVTDFATN